MAEYIAASAAVLMVPSIKGFKQKLEVALSTVDAAVKVAVALKADALAKPTAEIKAWKDLMEADKVKIKVDLDTKGLTKSITEIRHKYEDIAGDFKKGLVLNLQVVGLSLLPQAASALAAVNQSVVELSANALLLPGILSGVASAFGTLLTGLHGVRGAFTAYSTAIKDGAGDAKRSADATRQLTNANRDLNAATRDAKRSLEDLNAQMRDAPLDEATAILDLKDAQIQLADASGKTGLQRQRDAIAVEKAEANLANTRTRNTRLFQDVNAANKAGVAGNPAVLDALDKQAKAQEQLNTASKGGAAIQQALNKLSPNAQDFVLKIHSMTDGFNKFRDSVQDKLFAGLGDEVVGLGEKLPVVEKGFGGIATSLNGVVKSAIDSLKSDGNVGFLDRIFGNTAGGVNNLKGAMQPLIDGFLRLSAVGADFLPRLADGLASVLDRFNNFVTKADADGSLKTWMEKGIQAAKDLGNSFINIGSIMASVAEAFGAGSDGGFLGALERGTKKLSEFLNSDEGQAKLKNFFHDAREQLNQWLPTFKSVYDGIRGALGAGREWADALMPFLHTAADFLRDHEGLVKLVLTAYLGWKTIGPVIKGIKAVLESDLLGALKKVIAAVGEGEGFKGKLGALSGFMAGAFTTAAVGLALFIAGSFVQAFQEGGNELANMKTKADELASSLDKVTGAADAASKAAVSTSLQNATNSVTGDKLGNVLSVADDRKLDRGGLVDAAAKGDQAKIDQILAPLTKHTTEEVTNSEFYKSNKEMVDQNGGVAMLVGALNGNQSDVTKYNDMINNDARKQLGYNATQDQLRGAERAQLINMYDLRDFKGDLSKDTQANTNLTGALTETATNARNGAAGNRQTNKDANGAATLKPGNPFGPNATVDVTDAGGIAVVVPGAPNPTLEANVKANGGDVARKLDGTQYTLGRERAKLYANLPAFASGGWANGPGTGTSDSIVAKLSNREHVTKASVAARNPALFDAMNSGAIDPRSLPGFSGGGLASDPGVWFGALGKKETYQKAGNFFTESVPNFFKGALGLGAPGVTETSTATIQPNPDKGFLGTPNSVEDRRGVHSLKPFSVGPHGAPGHAGAAPAVPALSDVTRSPWKPGGSPGPGGTPHLPSNKGAPGPSANTSPGLTNPGAPVGTADDPGGGGKVTLPWDVPGGTPLPDVGTDPGLTNPGLNNPLGVGPPLPPAAQGFIPPQPLSSVIPGVGSAPAGVPNNLEPVGILQSIGSVFLDAILGFFGLNPEYIKTIKQGLGFLGGKGAADPNVQTILDASGNPVPEGGPGTNQSSFVGVPGDASSRATAMAEQMKGKMYEWGGATLNGTDCSGLVAYIADAYLGKPFSGRSGGTGGFSTMLPAKGAIMVDDPSQLPPGTLQIGWNSHHTSGTLPDGRGFEANDFGIPIHLGPGAGGAKEAGFTNWAYFPAMASGGMLSGPGSGTSDSIVARVSDGEFITKASVVAKNPDLFHKLNSGAIDPRSLAHFAVGGMADAKIKPLNPDGTVSTRNGNQPWKGSAPSGWNPAKATGAAAPGVDTSARAALGAPPANGNHVLPAVSAGIDGVATAAGNALSTAASFGTAGLGGGAGSLIGGATQLGAGVAKGLVNVGASLLVGTATPGTTGSAYGSPTLPQKNQQGPQGPSIVNQYGDIHTASYDEFYKGQQRREQQQQAPFINALGRG